MKRDYFLYIALIIPILMIATTAIGVMFYQNDMYPEQNFIYIAAPHYGSYHCAHDVKAKLFKEQAENQIPIHTVTQTDTCADTNLYIYNFKEKSNTQISIEEAKHLSLSDKPESTDGFIVEQYCSSGMSFMWPFEMGSNYHYDVCISKGAYQKKISIPIREQKYKSFQFIAWIKNAAPHNKDNNK